MLLLLFLSETCSRKTNKTFGMEHCDVMNARYVHLFGTLEAASDGAVHLNGLELPHSNKESVDHEREMQFGAAAGFPSSLSATWTFNSSTSSFCSKSQIRIAGPQAAQSQYRFGLNTRVLISLAPSKQWSGLCALSPKSQSIALPSCPPLAARDPSGETVTVLM